MEPQIHHIEVVEHARRRRRGQHICVLGRDVTFDQSALENATFTKLDDLDLDLLVVISTVSYVDRLIRRKLGFAWERNLVLTLPVHYPDVWRRVEPLLVSLLRRLTGDAWNFVFVQRDNRPHTGQGFLPLLPRAFAGSTIIPYSGGLDSFAVLARLKRDEPEMPTLLINARRSRRNATLAKPNGTAVIGIPFQFSIQRGEPTYRTRTFVFYTLAALAWRRNDAKRVWIGEGGIGCLGPSLVPFGMEQPVQGSHPAFTSALTDLLAALWGSAPRIEFPNLWCTKGMMLAGLQGDDTMHAWEATSSCSRDPRRQHKNAKSRHCGVCTGCLFRRVSILAGGLSAEPRGTYFEDVIRNAAMSRKLNDADRDVARCAVIAMDELAAVDVDRRSTEIAELACALQLPTDEVTGHVGTLLDQHRSEWRNFVMASPRRSWIRTLALSVTS